MERHARVCLQLRAVNPAQACSAPDDADIDRNRNCERSSEEHLAIQCALMLPKYA